jgi:mono/diheme cytochrome c family protein
MRPTLSRIAFAAAATFAVATPCCHAQRSILHTTRHSPDDLEITGLVESLAPGQSAFIRFADLLALPQTHAVVTDDPDYPGPPLHVSGITLETLATAVHALPQSDLIDALCSDRYRSHFPREYIAQHHPILVLRINGLPLAAWAKAAHQYDPSPYVVMYQHFTPTFKVLSHEDKPQLPDNLVRINFSTQDATFGPLIPTGSYPPGSPEQIGFTIAKQNCLRCHFMGSSGGTKSGRAWQTLAEYAREEPKYFQSYVHNPKSVDPHANMEPQSEYDAPTLAALTAYFRTFDPNQKPAQSGANPK